MTTEPTKKKILIVEDDEATFKALHTVFEYAGFSVLAARNGAEGVVVALQGRPDLILLDILMPVMDGWEMLKQVRESDDWGKCVPVVVLTNLSADEDEQIKRIAELGPSYFMVKADWKVEGIVAKAQEILAAEKVPCP